MSYNIRYDNDWDIDNNWNDRKEKLIKQIKTYNPSILGIQEGLYNQIQYIDSCLTNYKYIGVGREDGISKGEYSAIFYDSTLFRVINHYTFWLSETPDTVSVGWDAALERICTYGLFEEIQTKKDIWVFNTHFDHQGILARENSAKFLAIQIGQIIDDPVILMGDLNSEPNEKPIEVLRAKLDDAKEISETAFFGPAGTFNGFSNDVISKRIDYFFTKRLRVLSYSHIYERLENKKHISDHLPVLIKIEMN